MKRRITENSQGLEIEVSDVKGKEDQLLKAFEECAEGRCSCPTQEYAKLDHLQVEQGAQKITLHLTAKNGQNFDPSEIERCLEYTEERLEGGRESL